MKYSQIHPQRIWPRFTLLLFVLSFTSPLFARQHLHGHVPKEANAQSFVGPMEETETINLAIGLPLRNQDDLQQFLKDVYDPRSPLYHHFLTADEFAMRFGPTDSDHQAVIDFAKAHNLTVTQTYTNHLLVDVLGSVSDIQKTFHVNLNHYRRKDQSQFHAPDQEPSIDLDVPLSSIIGLENYNVPKPSFTAKRIDEFTPLSSTKPNVGTGASGLYLGNDFRNAYLPGCISADQGAGQTVALVEFDGYSASDPVLYKTDAGYGTAPLLTNVLLNGFNGKPGTNNLEVALDIEMIFAVAPQAQIYVVEGLLANSVLNQIATLPAGHLANQISCSWSFTDGPGADPTTATIIQEFAAQGQSYFQASGDTGAYVAGDSVTTVPGPMDLTSEMTVVGGTILTTGAGAAYTSETTWNNSFGQSSGGICNNSTPVPIPTYQNTSTFITVSNDASSINRNIPDVSMVASGIETIATNISGGVTTAGVTFTTAGTSAAAPLWAGLTALMNETASAANKGPMGLLNPYLYNLASNATTYANDFNDISTGNNNKTGSGFYPATSGYDLATGLGSPKCALFTDIVAPLNTNTITATPTNTRTPTITPTPTNTPTVTNTPTPPSTTSSYAYPQPASGQVYICFNSNTAQTIQINVYSFSAQLITSITANAQSSNQNRVPIPLQGITPGVYFYVIRGSGSVMTTGKFLVVN